MIWKMISLRTKLFQGVIKNIKVRNIYLSKSLNKNHYETLGVKRDATQTEIKNAYFELSKIYHPDRIAATDENLAKFREISAAYEVLGNEQSRKLYDRGLIGEGKVGIDEPEDPRDPIINFYRQRQQRTKMSAVETEEQEMDAWTQEFYRKQRKAVFDKSELFQAKKRELEISEFYFERFGFLFIVSILLGLGYVFQLEDHPVRVFVLGLFNGKDAK